MLNGFRLHMYEWEWEEDTDLYKKKEQRKIPVRGIEPRAAADLSDLKGGNVSRYTIPDLI